ncbi:MAG: hypothetical protein J6B97_06460 [Bacteroidales bacterium]|nr:hypothetical protein [Bacteroidales bacterium]MBQ6710042.1 hypothetical protein [Bacteroidales bacterium]MBQ8810445.1 hypothetical protein [Bacteroidales bacterium]
MKRTVSILAFILCAFSAAYAQDKIYFLDSQVVNAVVDEVATDLVYYRLYENQNGPVYSTPLANISKIVYHGGHEQRFLGGTIFNEELLKNVGGQTGAMRYANGKLYIGSHSPYGAMQADYVAFNLYGDDYFKARKRRGWGYTLTCIGASALSFGVSVAAINLEVEPGVALFIGGGAACMGAGIPLLCSGNRIMKGIAADYNSRLAGNKQPELTFGPCRSGVGFALNF